MEHVTKQDQLNLFIKSQHPGLPLALIGNAISPFHLRLPKSVLEEARSAVASFFELRSLEPYQSFVKTQRPDLSIQKNFSVLMSYDFHLTSDGLKLIEINTNASSSLILTALYESEGRPSSPDGGSFLEKIRLAFESELKCLGFDRESPKALIIDENPENQKMYLEFLLYQNLMKSWGWSVEIADTEKLEALPRDQFQAQLLKTKIIYNRSTDFYFDKHPRLLELSRSSDVCFSPAPHEYALLADKQRMIDIGQEAHWSQWPLDIEDKDKILKALPLALDSSTMSQDELWAKRKNMFFKPKSAFGGKMAYRGSSISRKTFEAMTPGEFLAQEYIQAPSIESYCKDIVSGVDLSEFKFDLRFYVYKGEIQLVGARVFKGQLTNFREPHSGLASISFHN